MTWTALGPMWKDTAVPARVVLAEAQRRAGRPIKRHQMLYWFGNRTSE